MKYKKQSSWAEKEVGKHQVQTDSSCTTEGVLIGFCLFYLLLLIPLFEEVSHRDLASGTCIFTRCFLISTAFSETRGKRKKGYGF